MNTTCITGMNDTIPSDGPYQAWQFQTSLSQNANCGYSTYLRPDEAGAMLPWLYATFVLALHLPVVIIRIARWERAQTLSLVLAAVGLVWTAIAYSSTKLTSNAVLVWMPLTLTLDAGAMLQLFILIVEQPYFSYRRYWRSLGNLVTGSSETGQSGDGAWELEASSVADLNGGNCRDTKDLLRDGTVSSLAFLMLIGLVAMQIIAVVAAFRGSDTPDIKASWCSVIFKGAVAVRDGTCTTYSVYPGKSGGIDCIGLPGNEQKQWLLGTKVVLVISLVFQTIDFVILSQVSGKRKFRGVKMQRPWLTMFSGVLVLVIIISFGFSNASQLPTGMSKYVWIYRREPSMGTFSVCRGTLKTQGLRGAIIGWTDGLFDAWGEVYLGSNV